MEFLPNSAAYHVPGIIIVVDRRRLAPADLLAWLRL
jgi:hypothetical protein